MPGELDNALTRAFDAILYATWYRGQRQAVLLKEGKSATSAATALFARAHTHTHTHTHRGRRQVSGWGGANHLWTCCTLTNPLNVARTWQLDFYIDVYSRPDTPRFFTITRARARTRTHTRPVEDARDWVWVVKFTDGTLGILSLSLSLFFFLSPSFYLFIFFLSPFFFLPPLCTAAAVLFRPPLFLPVPPLSTVHICFWGVVPVIEDRVWILFGFYCNAQFRNDAAAYRSGREKRRHSLDFFARRSISVSLRSCPPPPPPPPPPRGWGRGCVNIVRSCATEKKLRELYWKVRERLEGFIGRYFSFFPPPFFFLSLDISSTFAAAVDKFRCNVPSQRAYCFHNRACSLVVVA